MSGRAAGETTGTGPLPPCSGPFLRPARGRWAGLLAAPWLLLLLRCASGGGETSLLVVDVVTDARPVRDFTRIRVRLRGPGVPGGLIEHVADPAQVYAEGVRVAEFVGVPPGRHSLTVELLEASGGVLLARSAHIPLRANRRVRLVLARSCIGVQCGDGGAGTEASSCHGGRCVPTSCLSSEPSCGPAACSSDVQCQGPGRGCRGRCVDGVCLDVPRPGSCPAGTRCAEDGSCLPIEADGGPPDGAPADASPDASGDGGRQDGGADGGTDGGADGGDDGGGPSEDGGAEAGQPCSLDNHCDDANPCTADQCVAGRCRHEAVPPGTRCGAGSCEGAVCRCDVASRSVGVARGGSCLVREDGSLWCWGWGVIRPERLSDVPGPWEAVLGAALWGQGHGCVLDTPREAYCWGENRSGELGVDGTSILGPDWLEPPVSWTVLALSSFADPARRHSCGIDGAGRLLCWGNNASGQLGTGDTASRSRPTVVGPAGATWADVSVGAGHGCAIDAEGALYCWGSNASGQLGVGDTRNRSVPTRATGAVGPWAQLASGGAHSCAIDEGGALYCWGSNASGQLGVGDRLDRLEPTLVDAARRWQRVSAGTASSCAIDEGGALYCWGSNASGQLGVGDRLDRLEPTPVAPSVAWRLVAVGHVHACGIDARGALLCWGANSGGELGVGDRFPRPAPTPVRCPE